MKRIVTIIAVSQLLCVSVLFASTSEGLARRTPPRIAPLNMEYYGHPHEQVVIEPSYKSVGLSAVQVYLTKKHLRDKKVVVVWKTLLYTANYYLVSLQWYDKGHQYIAAKDERHESYCIDVETGRRVKPPY